jgi:hypothetical protein
MKVSRLLWVRLACASFSAAVLLFFFGGGEQIVQSLGLEWRLVRAIVLMLLLLSLPQLIVLVIREFERDAANK